MKEYIRHLRNKPESTRKQILAGSMVVLMAFVGFVWFYGLSDRLAADSTERARVATSTDGPAKEEGPFSLLKDSVSNAYHNISASVGNISFSSQQKTETTGGAKQIELKVVDPGRN
jgi:hypothetical protein